MKKIILSVIVSVTFLASCATSKWAIMNLDNKEMVEKVMSTNPELYERYKKGEIALDKIKYRKLEDGSTKYQFTYHGILDNDDDELLEWICIFSAVLNN